MKKREETSSDIKTKLAQNLLANENIPENNLFAIKNDFKVRNIDNKTLLIGFSTKNFPKPVKIFFIQKRLKEVLGTVLNENYLINDILIATEEAVSNIIEHSYGKINNPLIIFNLYFSNKLLKIEIEDYGVKGGSFNIHDTGFFNSTGHLKKKVKESGGGMGVFLIKKIMDNVKYETNKNGMNKIILIKKINDQKLFKDKKTSNPMNDGFFNELGIRLLEKCNNYMVICLEGYINTDNSEIINTEFDKIINNQQKNNLIFKIDRLEYLSSSGIEFFMRYLESEKKKNICFIGMNEKVRRIFEITGFIKYFMISNSLEDAKKRFQKK